MSEIHGGSARVPCFELERFLVESWFSLEYYNDMEGSKNWVEGFGLRSGSIKIDWLQHDRSRNHGGGSESVLACGCEGVLPSISQGW